MSATSHRTEIALKAERLGFELKSKVVSFDDESIPFALRAKDDGAYIDFGTTTEKGFRIPRPSWAALALIEAWLDEQLDQMHAEFVNLLDRCRRQVTTDPTGFTKNPHLYDQLYAIMRRLCHGSIHDNDASKRS